MEDVDWWGILGLHWMIDATDCASSKLADVAFFRSRLIELPERLGLTRVGDPQVFEHIEPSGEKTLAGVVLLAESHLSMHARPGLRTIHADIFSCGPFEIAVARDFLREAFEFERFDEAVFERGNRARSGAR